MSKTASEKLMDALSSRKGKREKTKKSRAKTECPLKKADVLVLVYQANSFEPLKNVPVTLNGVTPGSEVTDKMGIAQFIDCEPGAYDYKVDYSGTTYKDELKSRETGSFNLAGGSILVKRSTVSPVSAIAVTLKDDAGAAITDQAVFSISGPYGKTNPETAGPSDRFDDIPSGKYTVKVSLKAPAEDEPKVFVALELTKTDVLAPERGEATVELIAKRANVATPKITLGADSVPMSPPASAEPNEIHRFTPAKPEGAPPPKSVKLTLGYDETYPSKAYDGPGLVSLNAKASLWTDEECTTAFAPTGGPYPIISNGDLKAGKVLWVKGEEAGEVKIGLALNDSAKPEVFVKAAPAILLKVGGAVTPRIEVEHLVVLKDRELWKHQKKNDGKDGSAAAAEGDRIKPDPTRIDLRAIVTASASAPYAGKGKLTLTPANADVFEDEACTKKIDLATKIEIGKLSGAKPLSLWMLGKTAGKFTVELEMDPSNDPAVTVAPKAKGEMGCVELKMKLHHYVESEVDKAVNPDVAECATYWDELKGLDLQQKAMTDVEKVAPGRMMHVQKDKAHTRAKLIVEKVDGAQWPDAAKDYTLSLDAADGDKTGKKRSGALKLFDKDDAEKPLVHSITLAKAKAEEHELWIEGKDACDGWRGLRLSLGIDRADGGPAKKPKKDGDWATFTVVTIKKVTCKLEDDGTEKYVDGAKVFINLSDKGRELKPEAGKRKVEIFAEIEPKLEKVDLYFQIVEHEDLYGIAALADDFKEKKIQNLKHTLKPVDRPDRKKLLHVKAETDDQGKATTDTLKTSQLNLSKFKIAAYQLQDADQARYIDGHADLKKFKPVMSDAWKEVWQRLFFKVAAMQRWSGTSYVDRFDEAALINQMAAVGVELSKTGEATAEAFVPAIKMHDKDFVTWARAALGGTADKRTMYLCLISGRGDKGDADREFTLGKPGGKKTPGWNLPFVRLRDVSDKSTWLKSCEAVHNGTTYDLSAGTTVTQTEDFKFPLAIDLTATWDAIKLAHDEVTANDFLANATMKIILNEAESSSGVSWYEAVVVCMDTREPRHATQDAKNSATHTFLHEIGHYVGIAAKSQPDNANTLNPNFYSEQPGERSARGKGGYGKGPHCDGLTDQCIMWYQFKMTLNFCDGCKTHMRARMLENPKVPARDQF
jgi:hypothetical protein